MIYYFSGTGNTRFVAEKIAKLMGEFLRPLTYCDVENSDSIGIIFPVYAWGLPKVVETFIGKLSGCTPSYVWALMTCGDDMGYADNILKKELAKVNINLDAAFSVTMPNTYVCLPGMDIDPEELADKKVKDTEAQLPKIATKLSKHEKVFLVNRGGMPYIKSYILRPLFNKYLVTDKYLHTNDNCTKCGTCAQLCPVHNIVMEKGESSPNWQGKCIGCLGCYHHCPKHAIHFGSMTKSKGQKKKV